MTTFNTQLIDDIDQLNQRFIDLMMAAAADTQMALGQPLYDRLQTLASTQRRVAACPFLLFRLCFDAEMAHAPVLCRQRPGVSELVLLSLSILWQVAKSDLHAATLVSGADQSWCQDLAQRPLTSLESLAGLATLRPRLIDVPGYWQDLSQPNGISALQRASLGAAGWQIIMSRSRRRRLSRRLPDVNSANLTLHDKAR
ncbi:MAG: hypothetical protein AAF004_05665 [Pseudomonadota bacterium]